MTTTPRPAAFHAQLCPPAPTEFPAVALHVGNGVDKRGDSCLCPALLGGGLILKALAVGGGKAELLALFQRAPVLVNRGSIGVVRSATFAVVCQ